MNLQELGTVIDIDTAGALARFSNYEPMYIKYLKRFNTEPTYDAFKSAVESEDMEQLEVTAHTLKGIAGNLGLTELFNDFDAIVKAVRGGESAVALSKSRETYPKVEAARDAIAKLD